MSNLLIRWLKRRAPDTLGDAERAERESDKHLSEAHQHLNKARDHIEEVRAGWPKILKGSHDAEGILAVNSLTSRFLRELHER